MLGKKGQVRIKTICSQKGHIPQVLLQHTDKKSPVYRRRLKVYPPYVRSCVCLSGHKFCSCQNLKAFRLGR